MPLPDELDAALDAAVEATVFGDDGIAAGQERVLAVAIRRANN